MGNSRFVIISLLGTAQATGMMTLRKQVLLGSSSSKESMIYKAMNTYEKRAKTDADLYVGSAIFLASFRIVIHQQPHLFSQRFASAHHEMGLGVWD